MTDSGVDAHVDLVRDARGIEVRAFVTAAPPRRLRWQLVTAARNAGGTSNVSQSGTTQGVSDNAVTVNVVSPNSQGSVILTVFDGDIEVARETVDLARDTNSSSPT